MNTEEQWENESILSQSIKDIPRKVVNLKDLTQQPVASNSGYVCKLCGKVLKHKKSIKKHYESNGCASGINNTPSAIFIRNVKEISERYQSIKVLNSNPNLYPSNQKRRDKFTITTLIQKTMKLYINFLQDQEEEYGKIYKALGEILTDVQEGKYQL